MAAHDMSVKMWLLEPFITSNKNATIWPHDTQMVNFQAQRCAHENTLKRFLTLIVTIKAVLIMLILIWNIFNCVMVLTEYQETNEFVSLFYLVSSES